MRWVESVAGWWRQVLHTEVWWETTALKTEEDKFKLNRSSVKSGRYMELPQGSVQRRFLTLAGLSLVVLLGQCYFRRIVI
jgi:hypothetical protein